MHVIGRTMLNGKIGGKKYMKNSLYLACYIYKLATVLKS